ncbi:MAG: CobW family GTP-binding protein, partial [Achromobacter sp.]
MATAGVARIPLTVVGGFLGAGKTTLLNHVLSASRRRAAVLVNDFGPIDIDAGLVAQQADAVIRLANGCVCCSMAGGLDDALARVLALDPLPEWIVIEASGVSDPSRIAQVGMCDPLLQLEGVVVLVDVANVRALAADPLLSDTVARQLKAADLLVLNKTDLATP